MNRTIRNLVIAVTARHRRLHHGPRRSRHGWPQRLRLIAIPKEPKPEPPKRHRDPASRSPKPKGPKDLADAPKPQGPQAAAQRSPQAPPRRVDQDVKDAKPRRPMRSSAPRVRPTRSTAPTTCSSPVRPKTTLVADNNDGGMDLTWLLVGGGIVTASGIAFAARKRTNA